MSNLETFVTDRSAVSDTEARLFKAGSREIVLCEVEGEIYALDSICTHEDRTLDGSEIVDGMIECQWHGARYEVCSGKVRALPATRPLRVYPTRVDEEGRIYVTLPE